MCCLTWMEIMTEKQIKKQQFINVKPKKREGGLLAGEAAGRYFFLPDEPSAAAAAAAAASAFNFSSLCSKKTLYSSADRLRKRGINIGLGFSSSFYVALCFKIEPQHIAKGPTKNLARNRLSNTRDSSS